MQKIEHAYVVAIEGADGVGKTTFATRLLKALQAKQSRWRCILRSEPNRNAPAYGFITHELRHEQPDQTILASAFLLNRQVAHRELVRQLLRTREATLVLTDRSYVSSLVYQAEDDEARWRVLNMQTGCLRVDRVLYLRDNPARIAARLLERDGYEPSDHDYAERLQQTTDTTRSLQFRYGQVISFLRPQLYDIDVVDDVSDEALDTLADSLARAMRNLMAKNVQRRMGFWDVIDCIKTPDLYSVSRQWRETFLRGVGDCFNGAMREDNPYSLVGQSMTPSTLALYRIWDQGWQTCDNVLWGDHESTRSSGA